MSTGEDRYRQSTWLEFLFRRLTLARDLLAEDGVLLVSINDDQRAKLELLLDEALPGMRVGSFVWRTRTGGNEGGDYFQSVNHEHVLAYGKSGFRFGGTEKSFSDYSNPDDDPRGPWQSSDLTVAVAYDDKRAGTAYYPLQDPKTETWYPCNPGRVWGFVSKIHSKKGQRVKTRYMEDWISDNRVKFPAEPRIAVWNTMDELLAAIDSRDVPMSGTEPLLKRGLPNLEFWVGKPVGFGMPRFKRMKSELKNATQPLSSWVANSSDATPSSEGNATIISGTNDEAAKTIKSIFGSKAFNYAKPVSLIRQLVRQSTRPGDLVLDFFAGSATTAQAVMELNAEDGGDRRFIMVSSTEATKDDPDKNLCRDVTAERIRRLNASTDPKYDALVAAFAYLRTKEIRFEDLDYDLTPADAWTALEALHGLPLTLHDPARPWNVHEGEAVTLVLVNTFDPALIDWLKPRARANLFVYAWAPGQIAGALDGLDIDLRTVRGTLVRGFQQ